MLVQISIMTVAACACTTVAQPILWSSSGGGNDHWYETISTPGGSDWPLANAVADARGGYLATLTSIEENDFVFAFTDADESLWEMRGPSPLDGFIRWLGPWIGGFQNLSNPSFSEPSGGWEWVSGEILGYTNWARFEPNDGGGELPPEVANYLHLYAIGNGERVGTWDDIEADDLQLGFVVEYDTAPCLADFQEDKILDFSDVISFLNTFAASEMQADLAAPFGVFDFSDVTAFLSAFGAGCP